MKSLRFIFLLLFGFTAAWVQAQTGVCSGTSTSAAEGTFVDGFTYEISTNGDVVTVEVELLDPKEGLVAFAQTYNPDFAEMMMTNVGGQAFSATYAGQADGAAFNVAIKFAFAGGLVTSTIIEYTVGEGCPEPSTSCEGTSTDAAEGTFTNGFNYILSTEGDVVNVSFELLDPQVGLIAFAQTYNPDFAETPLTDAGNQTFTGSFPGFAAGATFNIAVKFAFAGGLATSTIIEYIVGEGCATGSGGNISLPVTFEDTELDYELADFGGNASQIVVDPTDAGNMVVQSTKTDGAEPWAGTTVADITGFNEPIPFAPGATTMTLRMWSPTAGTIVRLKVEQVGFPGVSVETETTTTVAEQWETLTFDFANQATGTAAINFASIYNKASVFFAFGTNGTDAGAPTFYWDDLTFGGGGTEPNLITLPVTFEDMDLDYELADFGGNVSQIVVDPTDPENMVVESTKTDGAEPWAGTTVADITGFTEPIPFEEGATTMTLRMWSPTAGTIVRLKVEQVGSPGVSVETETTTTVAEQWETLTFDFANEATGTAAINFASIYNKASVFFAFGTNGTDAGAPTFYWDDLDFVEPVVEPNLISLPVTFEDMELDYELADFGGNVSQIVVDPTDPENMVVESTKTDGAQPWAGTTVADITGFTEPIPFEEGATTMTLRMWSPTAGTIVRLKVEQVGVPEVSVETETTTTVAEAWETLTFDFANEATGTAAINFASIYNKASVFFAFGTNGTDAGAPTFYWDDLTFGSVSEPVSVFDIISNSPDHNTLEAAVLAAELDGALSNPDATLTVFAPTDAAFATIPAGVLETLLADPSGDLTQILLYHVLGSVVLSTDLADGQTPTTLQGDNLLVSIDGENVMINNAMVTVVDLTADNGVVHVIDAVLVPEGITIGVRLLDAASNNIGIYPNPSNTFFNIEFPSNPDANTDVVVYDMTGKIVRQFQIQNRLTQMDINGLTNGTYFMRINTEDASYYQKVVVVR
jgi:uncharacterized surface protein with fasciclin (FAS1) repeats